MANDREVYLVTLTGNLHLQGYVQVLDPIKASYVNIEIDATTGDVLAVGTSTATKDKDSSAKTKDIGVVHSTENLKAICKTSCSMASSRK